MAITLTRSKPRGEIGLLSDARRMNVGMTRARRKLLLVGDSSTLCRHPFFVELLANVKGVVAIALRERWLNRAETVIAIPAKMVCGSVFNGFGFLPDEVTGDRHVMALRLKDASRMMPTWEKPANR